MDRLNTLSGMKSADYTIYAYCERQGCGHGAALDLDSLIEKLGPGFVAVGNPNPLAAKLRCKRCGGRALSLRLSTGASDGHGVLGHRISR